MGERYSWLERVVIGGTIGLIVVMFGAVVLASGCAGLQQQPGTPGAAMQAYDVTLEAGGVVVVPPVALGRVAVPVGTASVAQLGLVIGGLYLTQRHGLRDCRFVLASPPDVPGAVVVAATAACTLAGVPVTETVVVAFRPAAESTVADAVVAP